VSSHLRDTSSGLRTGFSLIELLVVVVVIAVLAALLVPAVSVVRGMAQSARCASNLRMVTVATLTYAGDNDQTFPYVDEGSSSGWVRKSVEYLDDLYKSDVYKGNSVYLCPHAGNNIPNPWLFQSRFSFHFSMNDALCGIWRTSEARWLNGTKKPVSVTRTKANRVLFADGNISLFNGMAYFLENGVGDPGSWQRGPWPIAGNSVLGDAAAADPNNRPIVRHRGQVTQAYVGGHVAAISGSWARSVRLAEW